MDIRTYWQQGASAYHEIRHRHRMEELAVEEAKLEAKFAKVRAVPCNCELLDAHQCYAETHGTEEGDDSKYCRCRCHKIADRQGLID
jgi:hypothetical protein